MKMFQQHLTMAQHLRQLIVLVPSSRRYSYIVPEKSFTGKAPAVTVVHEGRNGTKAALLYHVLQGS